MPTNVGGCGVYDAHALRGAAYAASVLKNGPTLQRISPALRNVDFATSDLPSLAAARARFEYEALRAERDRPVQVIFGEGTCTLYTPYTWY